MNNFAHIAFTVILSFVVQASAQLTDVVHPITASVETDPIPSAGDSADDTAVWIHPKDASKSVIVGTNKQGGLAVYELGGRQLAYYKVGDMNNIDIRYNFMLSGQPTAVLGASNRSQNSISFFTVDEATRGLRDITARVISTGLTVYGFCMYRSPTTGKYHSFINSKNGVVQQWEMFERGGKIDAKMVRQFDVGRQVEGCAADDEYSQLYIGEESVAVWKYGAESSAGQSRQQVDTVKGHLASNIEGISVYYAANRRGYVLVSSQGNNRYVIYDRENTNKYLGTFNLVDGPKIDGTSDTDGIEVISYGLGPLFPEGLFIAQDGTNTGGNQNFKLVSWGSIARATGLRIDPKQNPRN